MVERGKDREGRNREREKGREFIWSPCDTERCLSSALTSEVFGDLSGFFGFG